MQCDVTLTHETPPEGEVAFVADCVYDGQSVEDLLKYEQTIFEVFVQLEPFVQGCAYTLDELVMHTDTYRHTHNLQSLGMLRDSFRLWDSTQ